MLVFIVGFGVPARSLAYENLIEIPASTTVIEEEAFRGVSAAFVSLPDGIKQIKKGAFADTSIWGINLPASLEFISDDAFQDSSIGEITIWQNTYAHGWFDSVASSIGFPKPPTIHIPESIQAGEDYTPSITPVKDGAWYYGYMSFSDGSVIMRDMAEKDDYTFVGKGYETTPGAHSFSVTAISPNGKRTNIIVPVTITGIRPPSRDVSVNRTVLCAKETVSITIDTHDAEEIYYEYHLPEEDYNHTQQMQVSDDEQTFEFTVGSIGWFTFRCTVKANGKWSEWSDELSIKVINEDGTDVPEDISAPTIHLPDNVEAGEDFTISIDPVAGAVGYDAWFHGSTIYLNQENNYTNTIYGYEIDPGEYDVEVASISITGDRKWARDTFSIIGDKAPAPYAVASKTDVAVGETYYISLDTTGAEQIGYSYEYPSYGQSWTLAPSGDTTVFDFMQNSIGYYSYSYALKKDEKWTKWSEPIVVSVKEYTTPTDLPATPTDIGHTNPTDPPASSTDIPHTSPTDLKPVTDNDLQ